jgi:hypothetical protein
MNTLKSNLKIFIIVILSVSLFLFINRNELFVNINNNKPIKLELFNCKNKLKFCKKTGENVEWERIDALENESTIKYYLDECNNEFKNSKC